MPITRHPIAAPAATSSPRDTKRVVAERKPILLVDRTSPNTTWGDLKILSVVNSSLYGIGADRTVRSSSDAGASWSPLATAGGGEYAKAGMFYRTSTAGTIITTWHPDGGGAPKIKRSTNYGATFADVVAAQTDVDYLGPTAVCQDPVTGYLYLGEYVTVNAATKATFKIVRSTDNGATWSTFHTFQRDAVANPTTAVRHCHALQWDPVGLRMYVLTGDAEDACGIYRVNAAGDALEAVLRKDSQSAVGMASTAVGIMFFPNYLAWGQDQTADAWLLRMHRDQIGQANPTVERVMHVQSCAWYTTRTKSDNTEWLMCASNQPGADVTPLDQMVHLYRVGDDGATCDEVAAIPATSTTQTNYVYPLGTPLQSNDDGFVWVGSNVYNTFESLATADMHIGQQLKVALGWGVQPFLRPDHVRKPWLGTPQTHNSGHVVMSAGATYTFGATRVPNGARKLFIFDLGVWKISGTGTVKVRVYNATAATAVLDAVSSAAIETTTQTLLYGLTDNDSAPTVRRSGQLTAGNMIYFDIVETGGSATADCVAHIQFAFGY